MGISRLTAMIMQDSKVNVEVYGRTGKYGFIVSRMENDNYRELVSSSQSYDTKKEAREEGRNLVKEIKGLDLSKI